jgi:hypothetical protein
MSVSSPCVGGGRGRHTQVGGKESVPELLEEARSQRELAAKLREQLGPPTEEEKRESRIRSVYASLAIEDPDVTIEEVKEALESGNGSI